MENMTVPSSILLLTILVLTFMSAYFSSSETALMKLNHYRLQHLVNRGHRGAKRANRLLKRQDRLLGVILIGNNLVNNCAALIAGVVCVRFFGEVGYAVAAIGLTIFFLIFAEVAPKTIAAERPEIIAYPSTLILQPLLKILQPIVVLVNWCSKIIVHPVVNTTNKPTSALTVDELRTVLHSEVDITERDRDMLLALMDLQTTSIEDVMIPKSDVFGIDISDPIEDIREQIIASVHTRIPIYRNSLDEVIGILHVRRAGRFLHTPDLTIEDLIQETREPYFVPDSTPLAGQLLRFRQGDNRFAFVVDEYGEVTGIITLEDIIEEVVGEFTSPHPKSVRNLKPEKDGSCVIEGVLQVRDINSRLGWHLPTDKAKTINGLILDYLAEIPEANVSLKIDDYLFETLQVSEAAIRTVRITQVPSPTPASELEDE